ncbi:MAG: hypothetical protein JST00_11680 [Deltaproteobacteria bacterium]|nr:hypothetical protein [Deltaproteobacteria bacterium]
MGKKITLPVLDRERQTGERAKASKKPSLDDARARLGGSQRGRSSPPLGVVPGRVVRIRSTGGTTRLAVVVYASANEIHALVDGVKLLRVKPETMELFEGDAPIELARIAADAHVFHALVEGQPVRYADDTNTLLTGKLVEKCRYGALIVRDDGTVVAVGFRKLWPATAAGAG